MKIKNIKDFNLRENLRKIKSKKGMNRLILFCFCIIESFLLIIEFVFLVVYL